MATPRTTKIPDEDILSRFFTIGPDGKYIPKSTRLPTQAELDKLPKTRVDYSGGVAAVDDFLSGDPGVDNANPPPAPAPAPPQTRTPTEDAMSNLGFSDAEIARAQAATPPPPQTRTPTEDAMSNLGFSDAEIARAQAATPAPAPAPVSQTRNFTDAIAPTPPTLTGLPTQAELDKLPSTKVDYSVDIGKRVNTDSPTPPVNPGAVSGSSVQDILKRRETASTPTPATPTAPSPEATRRRRNALEMGAPSGREESREFARGLFAKSQMAQQQLDQYRKSNPKADANDPMLKQLQNNAVVAGEEAQAGVQWATMTPSARQSVLTREDMDAQRERTKFMTNSFSEEQAGQQLEAKAGRRNLIEDGNYYNETGVMRGGAGIGTSTTRAGGVISAPDASGNRTLTSSPYGKGSITYLTPEQMKNRPEAIMDGKPASQLFDEAAMRQGRTFTVGGATYSPEMSPADRAQTELDEQKRKAEEERRKLASPTIKI